MSNIPLSEIATTLTRHGRKDGAAGQIRNTSSRTRDVIHIVGTIAEHLHVGLDLTERLNKLFTRLELGVSSSIFELAKVTGSQLTRGDYQSLVRAGVNTIDVIENSSDEQILEVLNGSDEKLQIIRTAIKRLHEEAVDDTPYPVIPPYEP